MKMKKRYGEAYIDVVINMFLSLMVLALSIELFNFFNAYHKQVYLTEQMVRESVMEGNTKSVEVGERYQALVKETGLGVSNSSGYANTKNLTISFDGSQIVNDSTDINGTVQKGKTIKCTTTMKIPLKLINSTKYLTIPTCVEKSGISDQYWKPLNANNDYDAPGNGEITQGSGGSGASTATIKLNKSSMIITVGEHDSLSATLVASNITDPTVSWSSADDNIATVDSLGTVYGINVGTTTVTATTSNGTKASCAVTVIAPVISATSISVYPTDVTMSLGTTKQLTATILPSNTSNKSITWKSDNISYAAVNSNGLVTATGVGVAHISATTANGLQAACRVEVTSPVVAVDSVELNSHYLEIREGQSIPLTANIAPSNATNKTLKWSSNDVFASVSSNGLVTGQSEGTCTITVITSNGKTDSCKVNVLPKYVPVSEILITPDSPSIMVGNTVSFSAEVFPSNATNDGVTWSVSDSSVGSISSAGTFTALSAGQVSVIAKSTADSVIAQTTVTVTPKVIHSTSVVIAQKSMILTLNSIGIITATVYPADATDGNLSYQSQDEAIATVTSAGIVTGHEVGTTSVIVKTENGMTAACQITVKQATTGIELSTANISMLPGNTQKLFARYVPGGETPTNLVWSSSNNAVASVGTDGTVTGIKVGQADITATSGTYKAICHVRVLVNSIKINSSTLSMLADSTAQLSVTTDPSVTCTWSSSNPSIAAVDQTGKVTAQHIGGTAVITATAIDGSTVTCTVTVTHHNVVANIGTGDGQNNANGSVTVSLDKISMNMSSLTLRVKQAQKLIVTTQPVVTCAWSSSDTNVATVDQSGNVTAVSAGTCTIKAVSSDGSYATCSLTVLANTYTVTANATNGTVSGTGEYDSGSTVTLAATANTGYYFVDWTSSDGTVLSTDAQYTISNLTSDVVVSANFDNSYQVSVRAEAYGGESGASGGTVTGRGIYHYGDKVTLTATPDSGYAFDSWNDYNTNLVREITVTTNQVYIAQFVKIETVTLSTNGHGTVTGGGTYIYHDQPLIIAMPDEGYSFDSWSDGNTEQYRYIYIDKDINLTANFKANSYTVFTSTDGGGTITGGGTYTYGQTATLTAIPNEGYHFSKWLDGNTNASRTITVTGDMGFKAIFEANSYTINAYTDGGGTVSGSGTYTYGQTITITAVAATGYDFSQWSDGNTNATRSLTVTGNTDLKAYFSIQYYTVNAYAGNGGTASGSGTYAYGQTATLTASPKDGYYFRFWSNGNTNLTQTFTVTKNTTYTAEFEVQMFKVDSITGAITGYSSNGPKAVVIPSTINGVTVTSIDGGAFAGCALTSITIPNSITFIGANAFYGNNITNITIPNSVETIGTYAFSGNPGLTTIYFQGRTSLLGMNLDDDWNYNTSRYLVVTFAPILGV